MSQKNPLLTVIVTSVCTLLSTILVGYLSYRWGLNSQIEISNRQKRQQVFSQLMGRKFITTQLYVSRFEAYIFAEYHERRWKLGGAQKDSLDLQETFRWMHKSEDLGLEIARNNQSLFETIGLIRTLFPDTQKLNELVSRIYHFKMLAIIPPGEGMGLDQLNKWKIKGVKDLQDLVEREYAKPIDELLTHLASEIKKDAS